MSDIDTSTNTWNPRPTHDALLNIRDRMNARLAAGESVRLLRVANLRTTVWRRDANHLERKIAASGMTSNEARRCRSLAETGEHFGLEYVGRVVATAGAR